MSMVYFDIIFDWDSFYHSATLTPAKRDSKVLLEVPNLTGMQTRNSNSCSCCCAVKVIVLFYVA